MHNSKNNPHETEQIDLLLFDQFSNHCLANMVEPLRAVNSLTKQSRYSWRFLTPDGQRVESSSGLRITPHGALADGRGALLCVMPSYGFRALVNWPLIRQLRAAAVRYQTVAGLDTGSWLLASAGLLDGYKATIHWEELDSFAETFPDIQTERARFLIDRDRITCFGAMATFDLVMHLIGTEHGQLLATEVAQMFIMQGMSRPASISASSRDRTITKAIQVMQNNLEDPLSIGAVAQHVGVGLKTLEVRMRAEINATPQAVYRRLRLNQARKLVTDSEQSVSEIAARCGYENASAMTRAFKTEFGMPPRDMRAQ